ncbi:transcriptional regulator GlxA family with amidase domain [Acidovorax soli]|uniref:Transcriptional regulator GlxA family with amidase domain n=1 Tax=Acidovorax soli TaxID=592050 RepID=A0A7X0PDQ2_9BURK|nr:hypothetical protein [Acidovorax soli]MBB6560015.1 transcriptional regulator GlxA family with amidase domain [Acidovorax soli]
MMRKITVAVLLFPRFQLLDLSGPSDAFAEVQVLSQGECVYEILTIGTTQPHFDTVLVLGGLGVFDRLEDSTVSSNLSLCPKKLDQYGATPTKL